MFRNHIKISRKREPEGEGRGGGGWGLDKSNGLKIEGLSDICLSLFFRDDINFNRHYTEYAIKNHQEYQFINTIAEIRWYNSAKKHKEENKLYYFSNILCYRQTCSNDHIYKRTTRLGRPMLNPPCQIPMQLLLYKTTTCQPPTGPVTIFFSLPNEKKTVWNNHYKTLPSVGDKHKATYTGVRDVFGTLLNILS